MMKSSKMIPRPDLLDSKSPKTLEVFQLTTEAGVPASHIYMEAQIFTPDSKRFLLHRSAHAHGSDKNDPEHRYLLCDLENGGVLVPVTDETGATAPSVSPDGKCFYYFVNETEINAGRLTLKRRNIDGTSPETVTVLDKPISGTSFRPSRIYPLSTIRSDGRKIVVSAFLGDGEAAGDFGLLVFDVRDATVEVVLHGPSWCNMHPQYSRSLDPVAMRDILIQENHGAVYNLDGALSAATRGSGIDVHVVRDDGQNFRDLPWGRDGDEFPQGHQCWRGRSEWAITSTFTRDVDERQLIESRAMEYSDHQGSAIAGAVRNHLSREFAPRKFFHFATDIAGRRFITDNKEREDHVTDSGPTSLYVAELGEPGADALQFTYLLHSHAGWRKATHTHPFLSPDGKTAFFNSAESGNLQAYMVRGLP
jgi:hypothetical protein